MAEKHRGDARLTFILADVRDLDRLRLALRGVDLVIHAAALKHLPLGEKNPAEMTDVNIGGTRNVVRAAIDEKVCHAVLLSTDKAVMPTSLYGASKLAAERLFLDGNVYSGGGRPSFSVTRYGNVAASRGSVLPIYNRLIQSAPRRLPLTNKQMTRFWMEIEDAVDLVWYAATQRDRGVLYVPVLPAFHLTDLALAMYGLTSDDADVDDIIEPMKQSWGEKLAEDLLTPSEANIALLKGDKFLVDSYQSRFTSPDEDASAASQMFSDKPHNHPYASDTWHQRLSVSDLMTRISNLRERGHL